MLMYIYRYTTYLLIQAQHFIYTYNYINKKAFGTITIYPNINIWPSNAIQNRVCAESVFEVCFSFFSLRLTRFKNY